MKTDLPPCILPVRRLYRRALCAMAGLYTHCEEALCTAILVDFSFCCTDFSSLCFVCFRTPFHASTPINMPSVLEQATLCSTFRHLPGPNIMWKFSVQDTSMCFSVLHCFSNSSILELFISTAKTCHNKANIKRTAAGKHSYFCHTLTLQMIRRG